ncbi:MAG: CBS domain-containing protein [Thermodesulfobacteriota bacterium]|jgi:predicted transcriptional regulator|nr:CBS domain-containing protein [Thermodesulfobacteriota bacterium]
MKVRNVFCRDISSVSERMSLGSVIRLMLLSRTVAMPVVNLDNRYLGCIEIADIIDACVPHYMKSLRRTGFLPEIERFYENLEKIQDRRVADYLPSDYPSLHPDDAINVAADLLEKSRRQVLPVVEDALLLGTLSRLDIVSAVLKF